MSSTEVPEGQERRRSLQAWRQRERDHRCQFLAATILGAAGTAIGCAGTGLIVYGLPTAERLAAEAGEMTKDEAIALQVSLMLYGRLGGFLLGLGIFLIIVFVVMGSDYRQHLDRLKPRELDARAALNRRMYADILRSLRLAQDDDADSDGPHQRSDCRQQQEGGASPRPSIAAVALSQGDVTCDPGSIGSGGCGHRRGRSSLRLGRDSSQLPDAGCCGRQAGCSRLAFLGPGWRANEAFDASDEFTAARSFSRSTQSMRCPSGSAEPLKHQQLFSVESEFCRLQQQQKQQTAALMLNNLSESVDSSERGHRHQLLMARCDTVDDNNLDEVFDCSGDSPRLQRDGLNIRESEVKLQDEIDAAEAGSRPRQQQQLQTVRLPEQPSSDQQAVGATANIRVQVHVHLADGAKSRRRRGRRRQQRLSSLSGGDQPRLGGSSPPPTEAVVVQASPPEADGEPEFYMYL